MHCNWPISYFFGGAFAANAVPHFVAGTLGRQFPTPFSKPPGKGPSSPTVNVLWGFVNAVASYFLVAKVGEFHLRTPLHALSAGLGVLLIGLYDAHYFGRLHSGTASDS